MVAVILTVRNLFLVGKICKLSVVKSQIQRYLDKINSEVVTRRPYLQLVHEDVVSFG